tara:strand:+ start:54 stop:566 length:513 start_codon:yes stop_codon:yes gene_type:complete
MATLTTNQNYLQPAGFRVIIDRENYPNLEYFAQSVNHPDVSVTGTVLPFRRIENVNMPGDTISFSELSISFILDENMKAYTELYDWMEYSINNEFVGQGPRSKKINPELPTQADISVSILSSHNNQSTRILYKGCSPTSLSGLQLSSVASSVDYLTFDVTFQFTGFEFKD